MKAPFLLVSALIATAFFSSCGDGNNDAATKDSTVTLYSEFHNFESGNHGTISSERAFAGKNSSLVTPAVEFGFGIFKSFGSISSYGSINEIHVSVKSWMDKSYPDANFVLSIDDTTNHKSIVWDGKLLDNKKPGEWTNSDFNFVLKKEWLQPQYNISLYVWNKGKNTFFVDNLKVEFVQVIPKH